MSDTVRCNICGETLLVEDGRCQCRMIHRRVRVTIMVDILCEEYGDDIDILDAAIDGCKLPHEVQNYLESECADEIKDQL